LDNKARVFEIECLRSDIALLIPRNDPQVIFGMAFKPRYCGVIKINEIEKFSSFYSLKIIFNLH